MEDVKIQALIEEGKDYCEPVETEIGRFWVRPLSEGERLQLSSVSMRGMKTVSKSGLKGSSKHPMKTEQGIEEQEVSKESIMDHEKWNAAQAEARLQRLAWGLSCKGQDYKPNMIKKLRGKGVKKAMDQVLKKIIELTEGVEPEAEPFSKDAAGADAGHAIPSRDSIGSDAEGHDSNSKKFHDSGVEQTG